MIFHEREKQVALPSLKMMKKEIKKNPTLIMNNEGFNPDMEYSAD